MRIADLREALDKLSPDDPEKTSVFVRSFLPLLGAKPGSLGAVASTLERRAPSRQDNQTGQLAETVLGVPKIFADERLQVANDMTTGANEDGFHLKNVSIERDIKVTAWFDLRTVSAGEPCVKCTKPLKIRRAIEVGHVFKLGTKYSEALKALFLDESTSALDEGLEFAMYQLVRTELPDTILVSIGHHSTVEQHHQRLLELLGDGAWRLGTVTSTQ